MGSKSLFPTPQGRGRGRGGGGGGEVEEGREEGGENKRAGWVWRWDVC